MVKPVGRLKAAHSTCSRIFHEKVGLNRQGGKMSHGSILLSANQFPTPSFKGHLYFVCFVLFLHRPEKYLKEDLLYLHPTRLAKLVGQLVRKGVGGE